MVLSSDSCDLGNEKRKIPNSLEKGRRLSEKICPFFDREVHAGFRSLLVIKRYWEHPLHIRPSNLFSKTIFYPQRNQEIIVNQGREGKKNSESQRNQRNFSGKTCWSSNRDPSWLLEPECSGSCWFIWQNNTSKTYGKK